MPNVPDMTEPGAAAPPDRIDGADVGHLGPLLGFAPTVERLFDIETRGERVEHLRVAIPVGLFFYNAYLVTDAVLLPDVIVVGICLHLLVILPIALVVCWLVSRISAVLRERLLLVAMMGVFAVPLFTFWASSAPNATYTMPELYLVLVYGGMTLQLRFPHMAAFTAFALAATWAALVQRPDLSPAVLGALMFQAATGCAFAFYGSYRAELSRRRAYLRALREIVRSDGLEADRTLLLGLSSTDPLTGLPNRRAFDAALEAALDAGLQGADTGPIALLMIDVDHFKRFNDTYGHVAGDCCLRAVATSLVPRIPGATAARYGGEEFAVVLPGFGRASALAAAEALRAGVEALALEHAGRSDGIAVVSVSIGVAVAEAGAAMGATTLTAEADAALYSVKRQGRNRCAVYEGRFGEGRSRLPAAAA